MAAAIVVDHLMRAFGELLTVQGIHLEEDDGDIDGFRGPSGRAIGPPFDTCGAVIRRRAKRCLGSVRSS